MESTLLLPHIVTLLLLAMLLRLLLILFKKEKENRINCKTELQKSHNNEHIAIFLLIFISILFNFIMNASSLFALAGTKSMEYLELGLHISRIAIVISLIWIVEHFIHEEGGKFKY